MASHHGCSVRELYASARPHQHGPRFSFKRSHPAPVPRGDWILPYTDLSLNPFLVSWGARGVTTGENREDCIHKLGRESNQHPPFYRTGVLLIELTGEALTFAFNFLSIKVLSMTNKEQKEEENTN
jgi:hypothetical protein